MENRTKYYLKKIFILLVLLSAYSSVKANSAGFTMRTLKTSTQGCGNCHGQNRVTEVMVNIIGPDTVMAGQTNMFFLTITKLSKTGAGLDIAAQNGSLTPVSGNIHLSNGELTHNNNIPLLNGTVTIQFNYTSPGLPGMDTIYATGLATNSDGTFSGDNWNWAINKKVIIRQVNEIKRISGQVPSGFYLSQNYPNPFNPSTTIRFTLPSGTNVNLTFFNMLGESIGTVISENLAAGEYEYKWSPVNISSGIYFYRLVTPMYSETRRMNLIK